MEKTVKLEQFKKLTEKELQEIQGGDKRLTYFITNLFPKRSISRSVKKHKEYSKCLFIGNHHNLVF